MKFIDLFAGLGGFHMGLKHQGHECVFASEIDEHLREIYKINFPEVKKKVYGDIRINKEQVPEHDILCAGFPCQPFSKSGSQEGLNDKIRGTLFYDIVYLLKKHKPQYVILENVGNFERHDNGRTWKIVKESLTSLGYDVKGTEHITSGGLGLISPHHLGYPHSRERFFIVAKLGELPENPFPSIDRKRVTDLNTIIQENLSDDDNLETSPTQKQIDCINHWNTFITTIPSEISLPSFPIWGDEFKASYPYSDYTPFSAPIDELRKSLNGFAGKDKLDRNQILELLPSYARTPQEKFPEWKIKFIKNNREWFTEIKDYIDSEWVEKLYQFPPSLRKLEWNCKGEKRDLWKYVLQFRPSGLRVKRYTTAPSLVSMTSTQIPFLGPEKRFLTRIEGLRLQGFPDNHKLPLSRDSAFKALGNAVHVGVVEAIAKTFLV